MLPSIPIRAAAALALSLLAVLGLAGCSAGAQGGESDCARLADQPRRSDGPQLLVIIDRTASTSVAALPAGVADQLVAFTKSVPADQQATAAVYQVGGSGAEVVSADWPLTFPDAGDGRRVRLSELSVSCLREEAMAAAPQAAGSDIVGSLAIAARHPRASEVALVTDGYANAGSLDLRQVAIGESDPGRVAQDLAALGVLPDLTGRHLAIHGLGLGAAGLAPLPVQSWLDDLYTAICQSTGAACDIRAEAQQGAVQTSTALPEDPAVTLPGNTVVVDSGTGSVTYSLSSTLLFEPDSAAVRQPVPSEIEQVARIALDDDGLRVQVGGHTAAWGTPEGRGRLSQQRAEAVAGLLVGLGVPADRVSATGYGATRPIAIDRLPDGGWDESAAVQNRRVEITLTPSR